MLTTTTILHKWPFNFHQTETSAEVPKKSSKDKNWWTNIMYLKVGVESIYLAGCCWASSFYRVMDDIRKWRSIQFLYTNLQPSFLLGACFRRLGYLQWSYHTIRQASRTFGDGTWRSSYLGTREGHCEISCKELSYHEKIRTLKMKFSTRVWRPKYLKLTPINL